MRALATTPHALAGNAWITPQPSEAPKGLRPARLAGASHAVERVDPAAVVPADEDGAERLGDPARGDDDVADGRADRDLDDARVRRPRRTP